MAVAVRTAIVAVPAPARSPEQRARARRRAEPRRGVAGGVLWIVALAALLGGVVALNVAVLDLNVRLDQASRERAELRASTAELQSQLSRAGTTARIEAAARYRLGLVPAEQSTYVYLGK